MDAAALNQPMISDEPISNTENSNTPQLSDNMNISMAFKDIVSKDPVKYTELREAINKAFEEVTNCVSLEEFKTILGDISFLKNKKHVPNLLSTLKTSAQNCMKLNFDETMQEENLSELFSKKNSLNIEEIEKYVIDNESLEIMELEDTIQKLNLEIIEAEESNEILFNQGKFNQQRYDNLSTRITNLIKECQTKYTNIVQQTDDISLKFNNLSKEQ